jgi:hypothetical protein
LLPQPLPLFENSYGDSSQIATNATHQNGDMTNMTKPTEENKHLLSLPSFWLATLSPLVVSVALMLIISHYDNLEFAVWTSENMTTAYNYFKVPLVIASLAFPLGAVVIASHRSAQTLMMADLQSSQNRFANYFLHLDRFTEAMKEGEVRRWSHSFKTTHDSLYPRLLSDGVLDVDINILNNLEGLLVLLKQIAKSEMRTNDLDSDTKAHIPKWCNDLMPLAGGLGKDFRDVIKGGAVSHEKIFVVLYATKMINTTRDVLKLKRPNLLDGKAVLDYLKIAVDILNEIKIYCGQTDSLRVGDATEDLLFNLPIGILPFRKKNN